MKQCRYIIMGVLCLISCGQPSKHRETLVQMESVLSERPDSVLTVLQELNLGDDDGQMLSYYAQGRVQSENKDYPASIISFFNAEKIAKKQHNTYVLGLIYLSVSDIYKNVYNYIEQQNYAQMAYDNFALSGKEDYILLGLQTLAEAHYNNKDYDGCAHLARQLVEKAANNDTRMEANGWRLLSKSYIQTAKYKDAKEALLKLKMQGENLTPQDYRNLCLAYIKMGDIDSASVYRGLAEADGQSSLWVMVKGRNTDKFVGDILSWNEPVVSTDSTMQRIANQNLAQTVANYHAYEETMQEMDLRNERLSKTIIAVVLLLTIACLSIWYYLHLKAHKREMEMKMLEAENIRHILQVTKEDASAMQQSVNQLFEQKFKLIDELCNTYYVYQGSQNERTKIYNNVIAVISNLSKDKKTIAELETFVNTYKNNLMADFRTEYPKLKEEDYLLFLYIVVDFSARAISILIGESLPVVYNRKSSLKRKIQQGTSPMKERFLAEFA